VVWSNKAAVGEINRESELSILWTPGKSDDIVMVTGTATGAVPDAPRAVGRMFVCQAPADRGAVTVPAEILRMMPVTGETENSMGFVSLTHSSQPPNGRFRAPLVAGGETEYGQIGFSYSTMKLATFK
jgi:hypothetical protein